MVRPLQSDSPGTLRMHEGTTTMTVNIVRAALCAAAMAIPMAASTSAQPPVVIGGGLVNVQIVDVIDDVNVNVQDINVTVGAAVQIAANGCGGAVGVISRDLTDGSATCDNLVDGTGQIVTINR